MFSNHVYKIIALPTLVIRIPHCELFLFCQHNSTGDGNLELRQTINVHETRIEKRNELLFETRLTVLYVQNRKKIF
jgi:hypothetical protein